MTQQQPVASGYRENRGGLEWVVLTRTFRAPIVGVWAAVTEPERLARWIGTWEGDPADGQVEFRMLFEGDGAAPEPVTIDECAPPRLLALTNTMPTEDGSRLTWQLRLDLSEADGTTTLVFAQSLPDLELAASMGPGWDYYLDRLVAAESGDDVDAVRFEDYYPALAGHYRRAFELT
jgi:uncharacterized protein YndB with AHSA1/START domain